MSNVQIRVRCYKTGKQDHLAKIRVLEVDYRETADFAQNIILLLEKILTEIAL